MVKILRFQTYSPLGRLYQKAGLPEKIRRSLNIIILANVFGTIHAIICGGGTSTMIGFANSLGAGDLVFGLLAGLPQAASLFQLPFAVLVSAKQKRKRYMLTYGLVSRALWLFFGFIPLVVPKHPAYLQIFSLIFLLGISSGLGAVINVCWFPWLSDLTPLSIRGRWMGFREMLLALTNILFSLLVAFLLDNLPPQSRYLIIFAVGGTAGVLDMACFRFVEEVYTAPPRQMKLGKTLEAVFSNKPFMRLLLMWTVWCFTTNLVAPYLIPYARNVMGLSFTQIMVFGTLSGAIATIAIMPWWGKILDRHGPRRVMLLAMTGASLAASFYLLARPGSVLPVFLHNFVGALFWSGTNLSAITLQMSCSPDDTRSAHIAVFSSVTALAGTAFGALAGGTLLEICAANQWFSGAFDRYKALAVRSVTLRFSTALLLAPRLQDSYADQAEGEIRNT
jgi:MFS family permease